MSYENTKIYQEQGGSALVVKAADGAVIKGQASAGGAVAQASAIVSLTDSTGGTANDTLAAVGATNSGDVSGVINSNFADLGAKVNAILTAMRNTGIIAGS